MEIFQIDNGILTFKCTRRKRNKFTTLNNSARLQGVSSIARQTRARGRVIDNPALSVESAGANARVHTFVVDACFVAIAVRVKDALGSTPCVGVTEIFRQARA